MCAQTTRSGAPSRAPTCVWTVLQAPAQAARQTGAPGLWDSSQRRYFKKRIAKAQCSLISNHQTSRMCVTSNIHNKRQVQKWPRPDLNRSRQAILKYTSQVLSSVNLNARSNKDTLIFFFSLFPAKLEEPVSVLAPRTRLIIHGLVF